MSEVDRDELIFPRVGGIASISEHRPDRACQITKTDDDGDRLCHSKKYNDENILNINKLVSALSSIWLLDRVRGVTLDFKICCVRI